MIGRTAVKARMRPAAIVEVEIAPDRCACLGDGVIGSEIDLLIFDAALTLRHSRSTKTLSRQAPLPSMLIAMPFPASTPVKAAPVNWEP